MGTKKLTDEKIFDLLFSEATSLEPIFDSCIVAGLVRRGRLLITQRNLKKTHPLAARWSKHPEAVHLHAEAGLILRASLEGMTMEQIAECDVLIARAMYLDRTRAVKVRGLARPCIGCIGLLAHYRVKRVGWTTRISGHEFLH